MNNLLPRALGFTDQGLEKRNPGKTWQPHRAVPTNDKNIPFGLDAAMTKLDGRGVRFLDNPAPVADPNSRGVVPDLYNAKEPSPLSASERGVVTDVAHIAMPKGFQSFGGSIAPTDTSTTRRRESTDFKENNEPLSLHLTNILEKDGMEVYIQRASSMQMSVLHPNMQCARTLSDTKTKRTGSRNAPLSVLFGAVSRISATITGHHEVKVFQFLPGPIGMEVEAMYNRLICSQIVPHSQASEYVHELTGAEVLSVNGVRVVLEDFRSAVVEAYSSGQVNIGVAAYRKSYHGKKDFAHFIGSTKTEFKSLLSNMMKSGIDKDHQHDIGSGGMQNKHGDGDSDESDSEDSSVSSSRDSTPPMAQHPVASSIESDPIAIDDEKEQDDSNEERNSDSEESDGDRKGVSIRRAHSKRTYGGIDCDTDQGMIVGERNIRERDEEPELYEGEFPIDLEDKESQLFEGATVQLGSEELDIPLAAEEKEAPVVLSGEKEPELDHVWDYTTALDLEESIHFSVVVCVPPAFRGSLGWGNPRKCVQFTNYSVKWDVQICWIDEEAAIVPRTRLRAGQKHVEMTSPKHLWILIATQAQKQTKGQDGETLDYQLDSAVRGTAMTFRPSVASLGARKYTAAMWIPLQSFTATQRLRAKVPPPHKRRPEQNLQDYNVQPNLMISIMDGGGAGL